MKNVDLTDNKQKAIALALLLLTVFVIYLLLPSMIFFFENLLYLAILVIPVLFCCLNYKLIWEMYKKFVWDMTKKVISTDKLGYMYKYHDHLLSKIDSLEQNLVSITQIKVKLNRRLEELLLHINADTKRVVKEEEKGASKIVVNALYNKINVDTKQAEVLKPKIQSVEAQESYLKNLLEVWTEDATKLKYTLDSKADEYKLLKELSEATGNASAFLKGNTDEYKMFEESLKQIENDVTLYTANIETFERKVNPILASRTSESEMSVEDGKKLVEEFLNNTKEITFK